MYLSNPEPAQQGSSNQQDAVDTHPNPVHKHAVETTSVACFTNPCRQKQKTNTLTKTFPKTTRTCPSNHPTPGSLGGIHFGSNPDFGGRTYRCFGCRWKKPDASGERRHPTVWRVPSGCACEPRACAASMHAEFHACQAEVMSGLGVRNQILLPVLGTLQH